MLLLVASLLLFWLLVFALRCSCLFVVVCFSLLSYLLVVIVLWFVVDVCSFSVCCLLCVVV